MINKSFTDITLDDIKELQQNSVKEGKSIDYKEQININDKSARKELAADITSFANTVGGDLLFGIKEDKGVIKSIVGIEVQNIDSLLQKIENTIRDLVTPRIIGLQIQVIPVPENKYIIQIRVPQSYNGPHVVDGRRFYGRNSVGKYPLDIGEIRVKFLGQAELGDKIRDYRLNRIFKIKSNEGHLKLDNHGIISVHIVPMNSLVFGSPFYNLGNPNNLSLWALVSNGITTITDIEGVTGYDRTFNKDQETVGGYHHLSRKGITEIVDTTIITYDNSLSIILLSEYLISVLERVNENMQKLQINGPFVIMLSLLNIKGIKINYFNNGFGGRIIRKEDLLLPEIVINDFENLESQLESTILLLCNAAGLNEIPKKPI